MHVSGEVLPSLEAGQRHKEEAKRKIASSDRVYANNKVDKEMMQDLTKHRHDDSRRKVYVPLLSDEPHRLGHVVNSCSLLDGVEENTKVTSAPVTLLYHCHCLHLLVASLRRQMLCYHSSPHKASALSMRALRLKHDRQERSTCPGCLFRFGSEAVSSQKLHMLLEDLTCAIYHFDQHVNVK